MAEAAAGTGTRHVFLVHGVCHDLQVMEPFSKDRYGFVRKVYIVCKQDRTLPEEFQRWMVSNNPVDEVKEIDGADHMALLSAPDDVVKCIADIAEKYN
ncbi:unnamed protein product [Urochloa humidicola]